MILTLITVSLPNKTINVYSGNISDNNEPSLPALIWYNIIFLINFKHEDIVWNYLSMQHTHKNSYRIKQLKQASE